jgi:hypothetical protein
MEDNLNDDLNFYAMEDDLNCFINGRRPQLFYKWKTTSIVLQMLPQLLLDGEAGPGPAPEEAKNNQQNNPDSRTTATASSRPGWTGKSSCSLNSERLGVKYVLFLIQT